ncbi:hypothetical protein MHYP_G00253610 [Metynnis hypsauchen]
MIKALEGGDDAVVVPLKRTQCQQCLSARTARDKSRKQEVNKPFTRLWLVRHAEPMHNGALDAAETVWRLHRGLFWFGQDSVAVKTSMKERKITT